MRFSRSTGIIRVALRQALGIIAVALLPALLSAAFHPRKPTKLRSNEVDLATVAGWGQTVLWVDARSMEEFSQGHISGAIPLNLEQWDQLIPAFLDRWNPGQKIVVYCSSRDCDLSTQVAARLRENKISPVYVLRGGWESWVSRHRSEIRTDF